MRAFIVPIIWAATIVIATWPLMLRIEALCGRRRWLAVLAMTASMLLVFVVPFWVAVSTIVEYSDNIQEWAARSSRKSSRRCRRIDRAIAARRTQDRGDMEEYAAQTPEALAAKSRPTSGRPSVGSRPRPEASVRW